MIHKTTADFWKHRERLPIKIQNIANENFALLKVNPDHPSLRFKKAGIYWSVRVTLNYRALAIEENGALYWFWIGLHNEYERLLKTN